MGCIKWFSSDSYDEAKKPQSSTPNPPKPSPNPDPCNWEIVDHMEINRVGAQPFSNYYLIVVIRYPNCTNYEGKKILVYENITLDELKAQEKIDPHFSDNKQYKSPIARFEPTQNGRFMAIIFCNAMTKSVLRAY